jgi:hypothetical protein
MYQNVSEAVVATVVATRLVIAIVRLERLNCTRFGCRQYTDWRMASISNESATVVQFTCKGMDVCTESETMAVMFSALVDCIWVPNTSAGSSD